MKYVKCSDCSENLYFKGESFENIECPKCGTLNWAKDYNEYFEETQVEFEKKKTDVKVKSVNEKFDIKQVEQTGKSEQMDNIGKIEIKSLSKATYIAIPCCLCGWAVISSFLGAMYAENYDEGLSVLYFLSAIASGIGGYAMFLRLHYKIWSAIQDGNARTTPGKAVGFLFIPLFSFYWGFISYWGWAVDYNGYVKRKNLNAPLMSQGVALSLPILYLTIVVPLVNFFTGIALFIILLIYCNKAIDGVNAIT